MNAAKYTVPKNFLIGVLSKSYSNMKKITKGIMLQLLLLQMTL